MKITYKLYTQPEIALIPTIVYYKGTLDGLVGYSLSFVFLSVVFMISFIYKNGEN